MAERLTRQEARALVGSADDALLTEIIGTGATRAEVAEALAWIENDEAMLNEGQPIPTGRVARVIEILRTYDEDELPKINL